MTGRALRIAILAHSTNRRGGVVHALELGDALARLGHEPVVHAPDPKGTGFFRQPACETVSVPATPIDAPSTDTLKLVEARVADYVRHFEQPGHRRFDVFHAQDGISGNALATLKQRGLIERFARTVHHIDDFADARLAALQTRSIEEADAHFVVSPPWRDCLRADGIDATVVGNGVDLRRFGPHPTAADLLLRSRFGLKGGPVFLAIGGVEARKNTLRILQAFAQVRRLVPAAQLVIAGGSSLLDHGAYQARFAAALAALRMPADAVLQVGPVADPDMPSLYRNADALVFPSRSEGFGLVVLEALASGIATVVSRIPPFTGYLGEDETLWCNPDDPASIADAMMMAVSPETSTALAPRGPAIAARHDWLATARAHLGVYQRLGALVDA